MQLYFEPGVETHLQLYFEKGYTRLQIEAEAAVEAQGMWHTVGFAHHLKYFRWVKTRECSGVSGVCQSRRSLMVLTSEGLVPQPVDLE